MARLGVAIGLLTAAGISLAVPARAATQIRLLASDGGADDYFGHSVAVSGDTALIGAAGDDDQGSHAGAAYVFRRNGPYWPQETKLLASDGTEGDAFGHDVAVSGTAALIGAVGDDDQGIEAGAAYVFRFNGMSWVQEAKLLASDGATEDRFGWPVALSGNVAVVGAIGFLGFPAVYVFRFNGTSWIQEVKLLAPDGGAFTGAMAVWGDKLLLGAANDSDRAEGAGATYVCHYNGTSWATRRSYLHPIQGNSTRSGGT